MDVLRSDGRHHAAAGKVFDRMSKGVREAPSKALIGELARQSGDRPEGAFGECRPGSVVGHWVHSTFMDGRLQGASALGDLGGGALPNSGQISLCA